MSVLGAVQGQPEVRSTEFGPERGRSRAGFGRYSGFLDPILAAEPILRDPDTNPAAWPFPDQFRPSLDHFELRRHEATCFKVGPMPVDSGTMLVDAGPTKSIDPRPMLGANICWIPGRQTQPISVDFGPKLSLTSAEVGADSTTTKEARGAAESGARRGAACKRKARAEVHRRAEREKWRQGRGADMDADMEAHCGSAMEDDSNVAYGRA